MVWTPGCGRGGGAGVLICFIVFCVCAFLPSCVRLTSTGVLAFSLGVYARRLRAVVGARGRPVDLPRSPCSRSSRGWHRGHVQLVSSETVLLKHFLGPNLLSSSARPAPPVLVAVVHQERCLTVSVFDSLGVRQLLPQQQKKC